MKNIFVFVFLGFYTCMLSQNVIVEKNDPKAKVILDKMKKEYDSYKTMEINFELNLEFPNRPVEVQKGKLIQDGNKYQLKMDDQEVYADGKTVWVYLKKNKEVQILDAEENSEEFMSPKQIMNIYQKGEYIYSIVDERTVGKEKFVDIEFKPKSKKSEFAKIRLTIDKVNNKMVSLRVFAKDASKYTLKINSIKTNINYDSSIFVLKPNTLQGVKVEDLRL